MAGKNNSTWRHDWTPTNLQAAILKAHGSKSGARKALKKPLKRMDDGQLIQHYDRADVGNSSHAVKAVLGEMQARENKAKRTATARATRQAAQSAHRDHLEGHMVTAENTTRGNLLNKAGRAKGIDGRTLLTANAATRNAYASDELRSYLDSNPVMSAKDFAAYQSGSHAGAVQSAKRSTMRTRYGTY